MSSKFSIGDIIRIHYIPGVEHIALMSGVKEIIAIRVVGTEVKYQIDLDTMWFSASYLRMAEKHEILEHKLCQFNTL